MRTYYWYLTTYLRKHGRVLLSSLVTTLIFFSFAVPIFINRFGQKPRQYIGVIGDYSISNLPLSIQQQISQGLTTIAEDGSAVPALAERWAVENDGKTFRFLIRKNIVWQDGKSFTPDDVVYDFSQAERITTPNDVIFKLPDPFAPFPTVVRQPLIRHELQRKWLFWRQPTLIGLGEYKVVSWQANGERLKQIIIENQKETLIYRFYLTENDAVVAFKRGEVDRLSDISAPYDVGTWPMVKVKKTTQPERYLAVFLNNDTFAKNIRQALAYATPKPDKNLRAIGPINPKSWAYFPAGKSYDYDLNRAIERLLENIPAQPLTFDLITTVSFQTDAESIKKEWEQLGVAAEQACKTAKQVEDKSLCPNAHIKVIIRINNYPDTSNFQALLIAQETPPDPDQYYLWHSNQSNNFIHYQNTRIDSLLEKGRQTIAQNERVAIYQEFQQFFLEDAPSIFLRYLDSFEIERR